jgi:DNA modification methylase
MGLGGLRGRLQARRGSLDARVARAAEIVKASPEQWIIWCGLNDEQDAIADALPHDAVSVQGSDSPETKTERIRAFVDGSARVLISKAKIAGFGLNLQNCHNMIFLGIGDSWETYYQSIRRCYRFGQTKPVTVKIVVSEEETEIVANVRRKEAEAAKLSDGLIRHMAAAEKEELGMTERQRVEMVRRTASGSAWTLHNGDSAEVLQEMSEGSVDLSVYSPPFQSLYTYTNSERDIGNCSAPEEFMEHLGFVIRGLHRVTKPGRLSCCHIAQVTTTLTTHGVIGLRDLRGAVIDRFQSEGWVYHGEVCIDKDPQAQAIRTKSKALLFVQMRKDSSWLRPALADYILVFRKPGENAVQIKPDITNNDWIEWARPIWYGIRESDTLRFRQARGNDDERHLCPLQLGVIERCVRLWSNPGETVLTPFAGIGSELYESIRLGRKAIGIELKEEYFKAAARVLTEAEAEMRSCVGLFDVHPERERDGKAVVDLWAEKDA